jgi:hypothetical protein
MRLSKQIRDWRASIGKDGEALPAGVRRELLEAALRENGGAAPVPRACPRAGKGGA